MHKLIRSFYLTIMILAIAGLISCGGSRAEPESDASARDDGEKTDAVSAASVVDSKEGFRTSASADGTWIIALLNDLNFDEPIVVEGEFTRREEIARKIALYTQDEDRNITERFTLEAPRLVIRSENTVLQGGTFIGEVYVEANRFRLADATIRGDVVFARKEYRDSFALEAGGSVTGDIRIE